MRPLYNEQGEPDYFAIQEEIVRLQAEINRCQAQPTSFPAPKAEKKTPPLPLTDNLQPMNPKAFPSPFKSPYSLP